MTDQNGKLMYRELVGKDVTKFRKTLNVDNLPSGTYTIDITTKGEKLSRQFELTDKRADREIAVR